MNLTTDEIQRIQNACEALSIAYARAIDFRDYDAFVALFAEDGVLNAGKELIGKAAIEQSLQKRPDTLRSRHVLTNIFVDVLSQTHARGISYLSLYRHVGEDSLRADPVALTGPAAIGHYEDQFVKEKDHWLFASRRLHIAFRAGS